MPFNLTPGMMSMFMRSCRPNGQLKEIRHPDGRVDVGLLMTEDMQAGDAHTLPFDEDYKESKEPLQCAYHMKIGGICPFEAERQAYQEAKKMGAEKK